MQGLIDLALRGLSDGMSGLGCQRAGVLGESVDEGALLPAETSKLTTGGFLVSFA
ncbi:hypothetical protein [Streptomyces sp. NPDC101165]|uniref:hypothetical protein n=1 Tax=Streptomyces sp. NPDC101165 TaxID=3366119 RepID=UPI00381B9581